MCQICDDEMIQFTDTTYRDTHHSLVATRKIGDYPVPAENQPRLILRYLAMETPVIAYTDCEIPNGLFAHLTLVKDYPSFKLAVQSALENK